MFANRGMGYFAVVDAGDDTHAVEDFSVPPASTGTLSGRVTAGGEAAAGVTVTVDAGVGDRRLCRRPLLARTAGGDAPARHVRPDERRATGVTMRSVAVPAGGTRTLDATTRTNWLSTGGGATIASVSPGAFSDDGAGPLQAIDQNPGTAEAGPGPETAGDEGPCSSRSNSRAVNVSDAGHPIRSPDPRVGASWAIRDFRIGTRRTA